MALNPTPSNSFTIETNFTGYIDKAVGEADNSVDVLLEPTGYGGSTLINNYSPDGTLNYSVNLGTLLNTIGTTNEYLPTDRQVNILALSNGDTVIEYNGNDSGQTSYLNAYFIVLDSAGGVITGPTQINTLTGSTQTRNVSMAELSNGNIVFSYQGSDNASIRTHVFTAGGTAVDSEQLIVSDNAINSSVAASSNGGYMVFYSPDGQNFDYKIFQNDDTLVSSGTPFSPTSSSANPIDTALSNGDYLVEDVGRAAYFGGSIAGTIYTSTGSVVASVSLPAYSYGQVVALNGASDPSFVAAVADSAYQAALAAYANFSDVSDNLAVDSYTSTGQVSGPTQIDTGTASGVWNSTSSYYSTDTAPTYALSAGLNGGLIEVDSAPDQNTGTTSTVTVRLFDWPGAQQADAAPVVTAGATVSYTEQTPAVAVDAGLTVTDSDSANLSSATVTISAGLQTGDTLNFTTQNGITGSYSGGVLTLTGSATVAQYQTALDSITFDNATNDNPTAYGAAPTRTLTWVANDGTEDSTPVTSTIDVTAVNDAPVASGAGNTIAYTEQDPPVAVDAGFTVSDVDNQDLAGATVTISTGLQAGDTLHFTNQNGITGSYSAGVLTLTGSATQADYQTALESITFDSSSDNPTDFGNAPTRTVTWQLDDGSGANNLSTPVTTTIDLTAVNDPPVVGAGNTIGYTEQAAPVAVDSGITVGDPDSPDLVGGTVTISAGLQAGDTLSFTDQNGISGSFAAGVLTLTGTATVADYQAALASITFDNASNDNPTAYGADPTRKITWQLDDGSGADNLSTPVTSTIDVTAVNDAPVAGGAGNTIAYTEQAAPVTVDAGLTVGDVDNLDLAGATVTISAGLQAGDVLNFTAQNGISAVYSGGVLTLSGAATLADYQTALESITFDSASDNPTNYGADPTRTVTWVLDDGSGANNLSTGVTTTIDVTAVNDPPVVGGAGNTIGYTEQAAPVAVDSGITVGDPDNQDLAGATITISAGLQAGDTLSFTDQNGISGSFAAGVLTLSGAATVADYQAALASVTFDSTSDNPTAYGADPTRTITWQLDDGSGADNLSAPVTTTIDVTAVDDAPVVSGVPATFAYVAGQTVQLAAAATVADPDDTNLASAFLVVTGGTTGDGDVLSVNGRTGPTVTVNGHVYSLSYSGAGLVEFLQITGLGPIADYQQILDGVQFQSTSNDATHLTRGVTWTVTDPSSTSSPPVTEAAHIVLPRLDFNNDNVSDVLFRNNATGDFGFYQLTAQGGSTWKPLGASSSAYSVVGTGDFNGDGNADILFRNATTGDFGADLLNSGPGVTWDPFGGSSPAYGVAGIGDFNGDGFSDVLFRDATTGDMGYDAANGSGGVTWQPLGGSSPAYSVVSVGDFNGDGRSDILFRDNATGDMGYDALNAGGTSATWTPLGASSTDYSVVGVGYFNADGVSDVLFRDSATGDFGYDDVSSGTAVWHDLGASNATYQVAAIGDFNADGISDVLFRNASTGDIGYDAIAGNGSFTWHRLPAASTAYSVVGA
jgi:hypothetical protein